MNGEVILETRSLEKRFGGVRAIAAERADAHMERRRIAGRLRGSELAQEATHTLRFGQALKRPDRDIGVGHRAA